MPSTAAASFLPEGAKCSCPQAAWFTLFAAKVTVVMDSIVERTFLFTDIEGSTRLWEQDPERMSRALAQHDARARAAVENNDGAVVKMRGDGLHAAFDDPVDGLKATLALQHSLADLDDTLCLPLVVRCGLHLGQVEQRDNDYFGTAVNRTARIMDAAHGGQILVSEAVFERVHARLPADVSARDLGGVRLADLNVRNRFLFPMFVAPWWYGQLTRHMSCRRKSSCGHCGKIGNAKQNPCSMR